MRIQTTFKHIIKNFINKISLSPAAATEIANYTVFTPFVYSAQITDQNRRDESYNRADLEPEEDGIQVSAIILNKTIALN